MSNPPTVVTLRRVETPVCCPQAGNLQGQYGGEDARASAQLLENCWFPIPPSNYCAMEMTAGSRSYSNVFQAAGDHASNT